jgi:DNA-binding response OmpR family regulator
MSTSKRILVVEDDADLRAVFVDDLRAAGFDALEAGDGKKGLELALKKHPDLILLDVMMPVMNGMEMMKKLRKDAWGKDAAIILLTSLSATDRIIEEIVKDEPLFYLVKSEWDIDAVIAKIRERLAGV